MEPAASSESLDLIVRRGSGLMSRSGKMEDVVSGDDKYEAPSSAHLSIFQLSQTSSQDVLYDILQVFLRCYDEIDICLLSLSIEYPTTPFYS